MKDKVNDSLQESVNLALEAMRLEVGDKFSGSVNFLVGLYQCA